MLVMVNNVLKSTKWWPVKQTTTTHLQFLRIGGRGQLHRLLSKWRMTIHQKQANTNFF